MVSEPIKSRGFVDWSQKSRKVSLFMKYEELALEDLKRMQDVDVQTVNIEELTDLRDIQIEV